MIRFDRVSLSFGPQTVLEDFSLRLRPGEHVALMGPSGCGKTTILQLAAGLLAPDSGTVTVDAGRISYVFQDPRLLPSLTALKNVNAVLGGGRNTLSEAASWLDRVGLSDAMDKYPEELSGGMRQRVSIARALAYGGELLLLDEPFRGLDEARRADILRLIRDFAEGRTLLLATHDPREAEALCNKVHALTPRVLPEIN